MNDMEAEFAAGNVDAPDGAVMYLDNRDGVYERRGDTWHRLPEDDPRTVVERRRAQLEEHRERLLTQAGTVTLHKNAPWNRALRNSYRDRFARHGGHFFKASSDRMDAPWELVEITDSGDHVRWISGYCRNLQAVRVAVLATAESLPVEDIQSMMLGMPGKPTGRNVRNPRWRRRNDEPSKGR